VIIGIILLVILLPIVMPAVMKITYPYPYSKMSEAPVNDEDDARPKRRNQKK